MRQPAAEMQTSGIRTVVDFSMVSHDLKVQRCADGSAASSTLTALTGISVAHLPGVGENYAPGTAAGQKHRKLYIEQNCQKKTSAGINTWLCRSLIRG